MYVNIFEVVARAMHIREFSLLERTNTKSPRGILLGDYLRSSSASRVTFGAISYLTNGNNPPLWMWGVRSSLMTYVRGLRLTLKAPFCDGWVVITTEIHKRVSQREEEEKKHASRRRP